jgi:hypothetical protein
VGCTTRWCSVRAGHAALWYSSCGYTARLGCPPREALYTVALRVCAEGRHGSSYTVVGESLSSATNRQVGDGGAQRLLRRGRHVGAVAEVQSGECGEAAQCAQPLVRHVDAAAEVECGECGEAA